MHYSLYPIEMKCFEIYFVWWFKFQLKFVFSWVQFTVSIGFVTRADGDKIVDDRWRTYTSYMSLLSMLLQHKTQNKQANKKKKKKKEEAYMKKLHLTNCSWENVSADQANMMTWLHIYFSWNQLMELFWAGKLN